MTDAGAAGTETPEARGAPFAPSGRGLLLLGAAVAVAIAGLYVLLPAIAGLDETWRRLAEGDPWWLSAALGFELLSYLSYVVLFRTVFAPGQPEIGWIESYRITMAGVAATRLLAAAGAGGIVLNVWALRKLGMSGRQVAARMATFMALLYGVFMMALVIGGLGLRSGVLSGPAPFGLTVVPAIFGALVIAASMVIRSLSDDLDDALARLAAAEGRGARWARSLATAPAAIASGVSGALALLRSRRRGTLGAPGWWAFDVAVLWACLRAFGGDPSVAIVVMAYFVGMLANLLPVPGGIGTVDGGMIAALVGLGVSAGLAIVAVLSYRAFAFWLPTIPGLVAYLQLVREPRAAQPAAGG